MLLENNATKNVELGVAYSDKYRSLSLPEFRTNNSLIDLYITKILDFPNSPVKTFKASEGSISFRVATGIALNIPDGWVGEIFVNRQFALEQRTSLLSGVGFVASGATGEIKLTLQTSDRDCYLAEGDLIAHLVLRPLSVMTKSEFTFNF